MEGTVIIHLIEVKRKEGEGGDYTRTEKKRQKIFSAERRGYGDVPRGDCFYLLS